MALRWGAMSRQKCASETPTCSFGACPSARTLCASAWSPLGRSGNFLSRRGEGAKTEYWRAGVSKHLNDELSPTHHSITPLLSLTPSSQSFGTHPRPGMYSRLPDEVLHPAATSATAKSKSRQIFDIAEI